ncbi:MAG: NADH-quinone oxidoreductase subunit J [Candidatus Sumerlaeaceae bacterium]|nr:NADH-quinone oxidoreductase subunit J [Candidatus Sumerlaeaceae bacterium]
MMQILMFYPSAVIAVITTLMVIFSKNPVYAVLYLIMSLFAVSMVFWSLGSPFLAMVEIIIYAGAIMVLFLFVVMMLNLGQRRVDEDLRPPSGKALILPGIFATILLVQTIACLMAGHPQGGTQLLNDPVALGHAMYEKHYLGVKLAAIILLIGSIGGMHLGRAASFPDTKEKDLL